MTCSMACITRLAASNSPRCSSSITTDQKVPTGFAKFNHHLADEGDIPREWLERIYNIQRWTPMDRGGHFAALEQPEALAADIRAFFRPFRG